jgi:protease-4
MSDNYSSSGPEAGAIHPANSRAPGWEREVLEKLAFASLREQRARRRWSIFFRFVALAIVLFVLFRAFEFGGGELESSGTHTALVEIDGTIEAGGNGGADVVIPALNRAYEDSGSVGVILRINSPGGSPVQAGMINEEIARLRKAYPKKPLHVVVDEMCASGGYYIAAAADKIFVNKASIVGSIGVLMGGFGFTGLMDKLGVERRVLTAGENKAFMDPFSAQTDQQKAHAQTLLNEIHQQFISVVRNGRGKRLKETPDMFSGLFWSGSKAVELGLADGFGSVDSVARNELKAAEIIDYTQHEGLSERVLKKFGAAAGESAVQSLWSNAGPSLR